MLNHVTSPVFIIKYVYLYGEDSILHAFDIKI